MTFVTTHLADQVKCANFAGGTSAPQSATAVLTNNVGPKTGTERCAEVGKTCMFQYKKIYECNWGDFSAPDGDMRTVLPCSSPGWSSVGDCGGLSCSGTCTYYTQEVVCS